MPLYRFKLAQPTTDSRFGNSHPEAINIRICLGADSM